VLAVVPVAAAGPALVLVRAAGAVLAAVMPFVAVPAAGPVLAGASKKTFQ
jgi:hypothetical protein